MSNDQSGPVEPIKEGLPDEDLEKLLDEEEEIERERRHGITIPDLAAVVDQRNLSFFSKRALRDLNWDDVEVLRLDRTSLGNMEIYHRFGAHKQTPVSEEMHRALRQLFGTLAETLDRMLPEERAKRMTFQKLEEASMWAHRAIDEMTPGVNDE